MEIQKKILKQCYDCFMKYGVKSVSMDDIAKSMGMSKKTIYSFFDKKDVLVARTVESFIEKDEKEILKIVEESIDAIDEMVSIASHVIKMLRKMSSTIIFDLQKYYPEIWNTIHINHFDFIYNVIRKNIERGKEEGYYRKDIKAEVVSKFYVSLSQTVVDQDIFPLQDFERSLLFKELIKYHLSSILSPKGNEYLLNQEII